MARDKVVAVCSGGFDSIVMLNDLVRNPAYIVQVIFFDYGQKNAVKEETYIRYWVERLGIDKTSIGVTLPSLSWASTSMTGNSVVKDYSDTKAQYVPMRNLIFASYALSYAESIGATKIFMAILGGGTYPDTTQCFFDSLNEIAGDVGIEFVTPFINHDKVYLLSRAIEYGVINKDGTNNFFSCNTPIDGKPCGMCADCKVIQEMKSLFLNKPLDDLRI